MNPALVPEYKDKVAGYLSYPLRASEICQHVAIYAKGFPFEYRFFSYHPPKQNHDDSTPYPVCEMRFTEKMVLQEGGSDHAWELTVCPVLRRDRKVIHDFLVTEVFPKFENWMETDRSPVWLSGNHGLIIKYTPKDQQFSYDDWR